MVAEAFDAGGLYEVDLTAGEVRARGTRSVVVSAEALEALVAAAVRAGDLGPLRVVGMDLGEQVRRSLGSDPGALPVETVVSHATGALAAFGWGSARFERWGEAMVVAVDNAPSLDASGLACAAVLGGMLSALHGRDVACVPVGEGRHLVVDPIVAETVFDWHRRGRSLGDIVEAMEET
ncbi:MAG: hypothetical protein NZ898_12425 [Myxococcota bacterium]|nr:hypothetical protein [Myxococcota bacterium]MDW8361375.1 hypothetical protein [Myxococcales bacterium]